MTGNDIQVVSESFFAGLRFLSAGAADSGQLSPGAHGLWACAPCGAGGALCLSLYGEESARVLSAAVGVGAEKVRAPGVFAHRTEVLVAERAVRLAGGRGLLTERTGVASRVQLEVRARDRLCALRAGNVAALRVALREQVLREARYLHQLRIHIRMR